MNSTCTLKSAAIELRLDVPLLPQITNAISGGGYREGRDAYDYLAEVRSKSAVRIQATLAELGLGSLKRRNLGDSTEAALAVASAALLDCSRGGRATGAERIDAAMDLLSETLSADW